MCDNHKIDICFSAYSYPGGDWEKEKGAGSGWEGLQRIQPVEISHWFGHRAIWVSSKFMSIFLVCDSTK